MKQTIFNNSRFSSIDRVLNKVFNSSRQKRYYNRFFNEANISKPIKKHILMYVGIGHMYLTPIEILIYHLLKSKGFTVDYCIYDEKIPINEVITKERVEKTGKDVFWNKSVANARQILEASNTEYTFIDTSWEVYNTIKKAGNSLEDILQFEFDKIPFGKIVEGALYRYYKSLTFGYDVLDVAKKFMITALTNYFFVKNKCETQKYNYVMFSHGIYCTWQPVVEYCNKKGISFICYDRAKTKGQCNFNLNRPSPVWEIKEAWNRLKNYELGESEIQKVESYLLERELQKGDVYAYNFGKKERNLDILKERLSIKKGCKVITIFTNLIWDAANVSRDIAFLSPLDCIKQTIQKYDNQDGIHILIRTHPAEKVLGTDERYEDLILDLFDQKLPRNVTIIKHEWKVNSFSVIDLTDIGVVHTSTVGIELAIAGKATVLISETHYRNKGFTFDANSTQQYFIFLEELLSNQLIINNQVSLAKKYFYLMMFEYQHKMPMTFTNAGKFNGYGYKSFTELSRDKEAPINKVISRISKSEPYEDFIFI